MKRNRFLEVSAVIYAVLAILILVILSSWERFAGKPLEGPVIVTAIFLAAVCLLLGYPALRVRTGSFLQRRNFGITAGVFCGAIAGLAGLSAGLAFSFPLLCALLGMPDLWHYKRNPVSKV